MEIEDGTASGRGTLGREWTTRTKGVGAADYCRHPGHDINHRHSEAVAHTSWAHAVLSLQSDAPEETKTAWWTGEGRPLTARRDLAGGRCQRISSKRSSVMSERARRYRLHWLSAVRFFAAAWEVGDRHDKSACITRRIASFYTDSAALRLKRN